MIAGLEAESDGNFLGQIYSESMEYAVIKTSVDGRDFTSLHPIDENLFPPVGPPNLYNEISVYQTALTPEEFMMRCEDQTPEQLRFVPARHRYPLFHNNVPVGIIENRWTFRTSTTPPPYVTIDNRRRYTTMAYLNESMLPARSSTLPSIPQPLTPHPAQPSPPLQTPTLTFRTDIFRPDQAETMPLPRTPIIRESPFLPWRAPRPDQFIWTPDREESNAPTLYSAILNRPVMPVLPPPPVLYNNHAPVSNSPTSPDTPVRNSVIHHTPQYAAPAFLIPSPAAMAVAAPQSHNSRAQSGVVKEERSSSPDLPNPAPSTSPARSRPSDLVRAQRVVDLGRRQAARNARRLNAEGRPIKYCRKPAKRIN